jgi:hypothetical protein
MVKYAASSLHNQSTAAKPGGAFPESAVSLNQENSVSFSD